MRPLTPRQQQVMTELCGGSSLLDIARSMCIGMRKVYSIRRSLFRKLGVKSQDELIAQLRAEQS